MKIWWCEEHKRPGDYPNPQAGCSDYMAPAFGGKPCRMVEMRLVSVDALVIEKVDGEWPEWLYEDFMIIDLMLDALASAQVGSG